MKFQVGDKIAHPLHGAGRICGTETKRVDGRSKEYYVMRIPKGELKVMIPVDACEQIGVRPVIGEAEAVEILAAIPELQFSEDQSWNKRYRDNMMLLKSGDLRQVAGVIKLLSFREQRVGLSNGERKMLHSARQILLSELMLAMDLSMEDAEQALSERLDA